MLSRPLKLLSATAACTAIAAAGASAATGPPQTGGGPPPPPTAVSGHPITQVAAGLKTPTSFAFGHGTVFEGDGGNAENGPPNGGVFALEHGVATELPGSPMFVAGLAWHRGSLYVSGGSVTGKGSAVWTVQRWSHFNGHSFTSRKMIYRAPKGFQGFNGIAFGPNGRLYVGVDVGLLNGNDHGPAKTPYVYSILTMKANGKSVEVYATGIRQPWQFAFAKGSKNPLVSDLGQDKGAKDPPDAVLKVRKGDDYGFPKCNWTSKRRCRGYAKPFEMFPPHTDIMGMAIIGRTLYMTSFEGTNGKGGEVVSMPVEGGRLKPVVTGFVAPTVGLGAHGGSLYIGELTGQVFKVRP